MIRASDSISCFEAQLFGVFWTYVRLSAMLLVMIGLVYLMQTAESLVLINSQGYIDGIGIGSKAPQWMSKLGLQVLKSNPLRQAATKAGFKDTDQHATEDAVRAGAIHTYNDGWMEAKLSYIKSNGLSVEADKVMRFVKVTSH